MCGITGILSLNCARVPDLDRRVQVLTDLVAHRGPDGSGIWTSPRSDVGFGHRRLSIIDLSENAAQPMTAENGCVITYNGEIYNYLELRSALADKWRFRSTSDTECILAAYAAKGDECIVSLRGMFAFVLWDERRRRLIAARDRFGIKPFYYAIVDNMLYFASEAKALLPFLPDIATEPEALAEYLTFQYTIGQKTLFKGIEQLLPGHYLIVENGRIEIRRYWDVRYEVDFDHSPRYFQQHLTELLDDSLKVHLRSDVPIGAYVSGGIDFKPRRHSGGEVRSAEPPRLPRPIHRLSWLRRI